MFEWDLKTVVLISTIIVNFVVLVNIKINDLHHLTEDMKELKHDMKHYIKKLYSLAQRVSKIEGRITSGGK
ncbi:MAG: hypothetical protein DRP74_09370 [Candidatus Omnitrophota bacterium]|nr:MAG: hypothetical protein DRP74_09370 [Candidatus Omnitrophota bacterium]